MKLNDAGWGHRVQYLQEACMKPFKEWSKPAHTVTKEVCPAYYDCLVLQQEEEEDMV